MSNQAQFHKYSILGVEVDSVTATQAIEYICRTASDQNTPAVYVVKPYVEFLDQASNPDIRSLLNQAELSIPDGVALNWAVTYLYDGQRNLARWLLTLGQIVFQPSHIHRLLPARAAGTNFVWPLLQNAAKQNLRLFLIGSPNYGQGSIAQTAAAIQAQLPTLQIVGTAPGEIAGLRGQKLMAALQANSPETDLANSIAQSKADLILVGMGFPLQETLMAKLVSQLPHGVLIGEGGTFDYRSFGGTEPKAPQLMQSIGLEWLWRLLLQPQRFRRQLAIPRFIWRVYRAGRSMP